MARIFLLQDGQVLSTPWLIIIAILLVILFIWLLLRWRASAKPAPVEAAPVVRTAEVIPPVAAVDDLEIIEGIGPKIASILKTAGVTSFAQLAAMDASQIMETIQAGGIRLADPTTWPEQARLAAAGDQAGLQALQDRLKAGREA